MYHHMKINKDTINTKYLPVSTLEVTWATLTLEYDMLLGGEFREIWGDLFRFWYDESYLAILFMGAKIPIQKIKICVSKM